MEKLSITAVNGSDAEAEAQVIVANRMSPDLSDVESKVYTRDLYQRD